MNRTIIVLGLVSTLAWAGASAGDPEKPAPTDKEKAKELAGTVVITNEVLQQLYGPAPERPAEPVLPEVDALIPLPDPMEAMDIEAGVRHNRRDRAVLTRKRITALEQRLQELETRKLAVANPYLARPVLTAEEAAQWEGLDNRERLLLTEEAIGQIREELQTARAALSRDLRGG